MTCYEYMCWYEDYLKKNNKPVAPKLESFATSELGKHYLLHTEYLKKKFGLTRLIMQGEVSEPEVPVKLSSLDKDGENKGKLTTHEAVGNFRGKNAKLEFEIRF